MTVRKLLDFVFTQSELYWLDHLLPEEIRREEEDKHKALEAAELKVCCSFPTKKNVFHNINI